MGRLATSWNLTKESWTVVKQDKELLWMPVLSFLATLVSIGLVGGLMFVATPALFVDGTWDILNTVLSAVMYLVLAFVGVYFHAATVAAAHERLSGGDPTVGSGLRAANQHLGKLFLWSIMVATVNIILQAIRERGGPLGQIAAGIAGAAWNLATFFVVPNLLFTENGVKDSLGASGRLFKQRWGETVAGHIGIGLAMGLLSLLALLLGGGLTIALGMGLGLAGWIVGGVLTGLTLIVLSLVGTVLAAVFKTALYRYAQTGNAAGFSDLPHAAY